MMINEPKTFEHVLSSYRFYVPLELKYKEFLNSLGYEQGSGSIYATDRKSYCVEPFTKKFWTSSVEPNVIVEEKTITYNSLTVKNK